MKIYDKVEVINDKSEYKKYEVYSNMKGRICSAEIRGKEFLVCFIDEKFYDKNFEFNEQSIKTLKDDIICPIAIEDLKVVESSNITDEQILEELPSRDKRWLCKVENGHILNLKGEKKNKIPYDYDS